jgi:hypothetical protein
MRIVKYFVLQSISKGRRSDSPRKAIPQGLKPFFRRGLNVGAKAPT